MNRLAYILPIATLASLTVVSCMHTSVTRVGRMPLGGGQEGLAPILKVISVEHEQVAVISVNSSSFGNAQRPTNYLRRRASLLGCDGVYRIKHTASKTVGTCIRNKSPGHVSPTPMVVRTPSHDLIHRVSKDPIHGLALVKILNRISSLPANKRAWQLQWYLQRYPQSPYSDEVEGLFIASADFGKAKGHASLRAAPLNR